MNVGGGQDQAWKQEQGDSDDQFGIRFKGEQKSCHQA